jgi:putative flavoprotein involved in K+ transport
MKRFDTVVIGAGQAGLATSYCLGQRGQEHIVLERAGAVAPVWKDQRWDSFTLITPNWALRMPGGEYDGPEPEAFMTRDDVARYFDNYAGAHHLPVRTGVEVEQVRRRDDGSYEVATNQGPWLARNVVVATGYEQSPHIPAFAGAISPEIAQIHSRDYRNPGQLPPGAVLVVGSAQSGAQIAEELLEHGRTVLLSVSNAGRGPRRYRGRDIFAWLFELGFFDLPPDKMPGPPGAPFVAPHVTGKDGGRTLNLHQFARDGMRLLGHVVGAEGSTLTIAPDVHACLARADGFADNARKMIDGYIAACGLDAPEETVEEPRDGFDQPVIERLDLKDAGVSAIIWATGFTHDYSLVDLPVLTDTGAPVQERGVTDFPGLYFVGLPWMPGLRSGILAGVGESATHIADHIAARAPATAAAD